MAKIQFLSTLLRAIQGRPSEAQAMARVDAIAEKDLHQVETSVDALTQTAEKLELQAEQARNRAARLADRARELELERQQLADRLQLAQESSAKAYAAAVADGDTAAEAEALATPDDIAMLPLRIDQLGRQLDALQLEAARAGDLAALTTNEADAARKAVLDRRREEAHIQFDEAANALLLAAARVYSAYSAANRTLPGQMQNLRVDYFSRERSVYAEVTGKREFPGHPPPVITAGSVRDVVRATEAREQAATAAMATAPTAPANSTIVDA